MRCTSAQRHLIPGTADMFGARTRDAAERHVAGCAACREELRLTRALFTALDEASIEETPVPVRLEQATLRAVRIAAAEEAERPARAWWADWFRVPALAVAAVGAVALVTTLRSAGDPPSARPSVAPQVAARPAAAPPVVAKAAPAPVAAKKEEAPHVVAQRRDIEPTPTEPPQELADRPDLFIDLPILRHMEKLEHYEQIETTSSPDGSGDPAGGEGQTNG